ncbi:MAG: hypothetical protein ABI175_21910, partial [Polyangiales bacterium]
MSSSSPPPKKNRPRSPADGQGKRAGKARPRGRKGSIWFPIGALFLGSAGAYVVLTSCGKGGDPPQPKGVTSAIAPGATNEPAGASSGNGLIDPSDGGDNNLVAIPGDAYIDDRETGTSAAPGDGPMLGAAHFQTHVFEKPDYSSTRIGYLRAGAKVGIVGAIPGEAVKRIKSPSCKEGWIAIQPRGYVCLDKGGGALNLEQPNVKLATAPPNFDDFLPYKYGFVWRNGTPLYRKVPTPKEWKEKEPWLAPKPKPKPKVDPDLGEGDTTSAMTEADFLDGGVPAKPESTLPDLLDAGAPASADAGAWWERDAGKGEISLKDTMEAEGLVARRMAKGFAIAIDRTFMWSGRAWHRTTMGLVAPADSVTIIKAPEFKGVELGPDLQLPLAWSLIKESGIYESKDKKIFAIKDRFKRQTAIRLLSPSTAGYEEVTTGGITYVPTFDGRWVRAKDVARMDAVAPPADLKPDEKWIDVSIKSQALVLY